MDTAKERAIVRACLHFGGVSRKCPNCDAPAGEPCPRRPVEFARPAWSEEAGPAVHIGQPVVCMARAIDELEMVAIKARLARCQTDADYDAVLPELESLRIARFRGVTASWTATRDQDARNAAAERRYKRAQKRLHAAVRGGWPRVGSS